MLKDNGSKLSTSLCQEIHQLERRVITNTNTRRKENSESLMAFLELKFVIKLKKTLGLHCLNGGNTQNILRTTIASITTETLLGNRESWS